MAPSLDEIIQSLIVSNDVPDAATITYIRDAIQKLDGAIAKTYGARFRKTKEEILRERRMLQDARRVYSGIISPVRRITNNIWAKIFSYNIIENKEELAAYQQVCFNWNVASYTPMLWTQIKMDLYYDEERDRVQVEDVFQVVNSFNYARPLPLDITISYDLHRDLFEVGQNDVELLPNKSRWRSLTAGPSALHMLMRRKSGFFFEWLEEVVVRSSNKNIMDEQDVDGLCMLGLTKLTRLTLEIESGIDRDSVLVPWYQLTHLTLDSRYSDASDYLHILAVCAKLEVCELILNRSPYPPRLLPFPAGTRLCLPKMKKFVLRGRMRPTLFLSFLAMPALESLTVTWKDDGVASFHEEPGAQIALFVLESQCKIKTFELHAKDIWFSDLTLALRAMHTVKDITLYISNCPSMATIDEPLDDYSDDENGRREDISPFSLPYLEEFVIHSKFFAIPLAWFMEIVRPKKLTIGTPEDVECYRGEDCVSFIYGDGYLNVLSGYEGLTKKMMACYIEAEYENVEIVV